MMMEVCGALRCLLSLALWAAGLVLLLRGETIIRFSCNPIIFTFNPGQRVIALTGLFCQIHRSQHSPGTSSAPNPPRMMFVPKLEGRTRATSPSKSICIVFQRYFNNNLVHMISPSHCGAPWKLERFYFAENYSNYKLLRNECNLMNLLRSSLRSDPFTSQNALPSPRSCQLSDESH